MFNKTMLFIAFCAGLPRGVSKSTINLNMASVSSALL